MKQLIYNPRVWIISMVLAIAIIAIIAVPNEGTPLLKWILLLLGSKAVGIGFIALACSLYRRWSKQGKLDGLDDFLKE